jgi:hypothetical protein
MIKTYIYKSFYYDRKGKNIDPIYIIHNAQNIKSANQDAMSYFNNYILDKYSNRGSDYKNKLRKNVIVKTIKLS